MSRIIGIVSGKGGVGKTTFSSNLAIALSKLNKKVLLIDCNVTTPHLAYYLGSKYFTGTINDVLLGKIDIKYAPTATNNILFIPASDNFEDLFNMDMSKLEKHVDKLAKDGDYDFIFLDSAPGLGKEAISVFKACEEILFVTTPTIPNLSDVTKCAEVAQRMGIEDFNVVLNMVRKSHFELTANEISKMVYFPLLGVIPFDKNIMDSTAKGFPYLLDRPDSRVESGYMEIASILAGVEYNKPSLLDKFRNKLKDISSKIRFHK